MFGPRLPPTKGSSMTPYYEDDACVIYHGDCREITEWLSADVLVTDPPYGMGYASSKARAGKGKYRRRELSPIAGDATTELRDIALDLWGDRAALVFGTWRVDRPATARMLLVWDKGDSPGMGDLTIPWGPSHEEVYVIGAGFTGKRTPGVLRWPGLMSQDSERPDHPTPKPLPLMRDLIGKCPPGVIADPFMGSGTTLRAAKDLNRKAIGIELDERYCEIAAKRMAQEVLAL